MTRFYVRRWDSGWNCWVYLVGGQSEFSEKAKPKTSKFREWFTYTPEELKHIDTTGYVVTEVAANES